MRLVQSLREFLLRLLFLAILLGAAWLVLQFYSEAELVAAASGFWAWWSTLFTGSLATYWNPVGAAVVLGVAVLFVLNPILRLFRSRRHGSHHNDDYDDFGGSDDSGSD